MSTSDKNSCIEDFCQSHPLLIEHLEAVLKQNETLNLTSIKDKEAGKVLHIADSLAVLAEVNEAPEGSLADLGSGAGYPGIPLALVSGRRTTLIESSKKKAQFLSTFIEQNNLEDLIQVAAVRSEELALTHPQAYTVVTARAVAELPALLEMAAPLLKEDGLFIALKGRPTQDEITRGNQAAVQLGLTLIKTRDYTLTSDNSQRCVLVYKSTDDALISLPRRAGMAVKRPLA